jgi:hypothetical protein
MPQQPNHTHHIRDQEKKGLHKDWRTWAVVILMLVAMAAYVLTDDEALGSRRQSQEAMEAVGE